MSARTFRNLARVIFKSILAKLETFELKAILRKSSGKMPGPISATGPNAAFSHAWDQLGHTSHRRSELGVRYMRQIIRGGSIVIMYLEPITIPLVTSIGSAGRQE